jgi:hypothetical protein
MKAVLVVPTRNRAELAASSIASALADRDPRASVLVSDNSTDPEQMELLRSWCAERADEPLQYVRPPEPLPMSAHWQWALERALESPAVTHVMYVTDRLLVRPGTLGRLLTIAENHRGDVVTFGDDTVIDYRRPVTIFQRPWTGKLLRIRTDQLLRVLGRGILLGAPTMLNTIAPRAVMEDINQTYGSVFASIAPDHCFSYRCL